MKQFAGETAFVVGGSKGIGLSTARLLAAAGAHVVAFARTPGSLEAAVAGLERRRVSPGQRFAARRLDVSDHVAVDQVMGAAVAEFGAPGLLVNSAGRALPHRFEDLTYEQFDETMKVNLYGVWNAVAAVAPHMKARGGAIVNVSSVAGFLGVFGLTDYCASKFAVIGFSEALRQELRPSGIAVSVLCPPDTDTPGFATENLTKPAETMAVSAGARLMQPDDVARALLDGVRRGRFMIVPGGGRPVYALKRFAPGIVDASVRRTIAKVQAQAGGSSARR
jgi:3-dehydrosphinganine reductase